MSPQQTIAGLRSLQRHLAGAILRPLASGQRLDPGPYCGRPVSDFAAEWIRPGRRQTALERLEIYNRQYWFRLLECLEEDFPGLKAVLGPRAFHRLACAYLTAHPSSSYTLRNLGQHLVRFLGERHHPLGPRQAVAFDMARLEWAHVEAFDAAAEPPLSLEDLRGVDPRMLRLRLQPHLTLLRLEHSLENVLIRIRRQNIGLRAEASQAKGEPLRRRARRLSIRKSRGPIFLAVHRQEGTVYYKRLLRGQYLLLTSLNAGRSLAAACTAAFGSRSGPRQTLLLAAWFQDWSTMGWFVNRNPTDRKRRGSERTPADLASP